MRIRELIDTTNRTIFRVSSRLRRSSFAVTRDLARADYSFWDKARRGKAKGLELSGLFLKPLASKIAAWTLGRRPQWKTENERSGEELDQWWNNQHADILRAWKEALALGDHFVVVNSDLTVTVVPPHVVDPIVAQDDFTKIIGWRITEVIPHPERISVMRIVDEYTVMQRERTVQIDGSTLQTEVFPNLIGMLPIIHVPNLNGSDAMFGRPEGEALEPALHRYGELFDAAIEGNIRQGRSTPTLLFALKEDLKLWWDSYAQRQTRTLPDGTTETYYDVEFDGDKLLAASGATFDYKSPQSFSADTEKLLGLLFYLILQHTEIPEFIWGNAITSSHASAEAQLGPFLEYIDMRRGEIAKWLTTIAEVVLSYLSLVEPGVVSETPQIQWESLASNDGNLTLSTVQWAFSEGLIDAKTALILAPVDIEDINAVLDKAKEENEAAQPENQETPEPQLNAALQAEIDRLEAGGD